MQQEQLGVPYFDFHHCIVHLSTQRFYSGGIYKANRFICVIYVIRTKFRSKAGRSVEFHSDVISLVTFPDSPQTFLNRILCVKPLEPTSTAIRVYINRVLIIRVRNIRVLINRVLIIYVLIIRVLIMRVLIIRVLIIRVLIIRVRIMRVRTNTDNKNTDITY